MTHRRKILRCLLLIGLVLVAGWVWFTRLHTPARKIVEVGARLSGADLDFLLPEVRARLASEGFHISSRTLVVLPPKPGVLFSTVTKPGNQEQFTYLILIRYGRRIRGYSDTLGRRPWIPICTFDGTVAETNDQIELNGSPIEASYRVELNDTRTAVANESLTIGGKCVDMASGQVFLIDLTDESPVYRQMKVALPATPSKLETTEDAKRAAEAIRTSLESQDPEIKAFLRRRERLMN